MFLIIPSERKIDWSHPPRVTLVLIIINILVFLFLQQNDNQKLEDALQFYMKSPLMEIELPLYRQLKSQQKNQSTSSVNADDIFKMLFDFQWQQKLKSGLITKNDPLYDSWYENRKIFQQKIDKVIFLHYGLVPANYSLKTALTSTFLHGDMWHLLGNMVFLLVFGFSLEKILGAGKYLILYFISGVGGGSLFMLLNSHSYTPLIGASGAIAGLMGAFAVIYGLRKIQFFIWIVGYFNYVKLPALVVLPIWIIKEIWSNQQTIDSNVAYMAHVGGLMTGAIVATIFTQQKVQQISTINSDYLDSSDEEDFRDPVAEQLEAAINFMRHLNFPKAKVQLLQLLKSQPGNLRALELLYHIEKLKPEDKLFKNVCERIFKITEKDKSLDDWIFNLYKEIRSLNPRLGISVNRLSNLCYRFIRSEHFADSEDIIRLIEGARPDFEPLPDMILTLSSSYLKSGQRHKGRDWLMKLEQEFKHTEQSGHASYLLDRLDNNQDF